jgi:putative endopeptidase
MLLLLACTPAGPIGPGVPDTEAPVVEKVSLERVGLSAKAMDRSTDPCNDFYRFACGGWNDTTEIPSDKPRWNRSFSEIYQRNEKDLREILEAANSSKEANVKKMGDFYAACMDEVAVEKAGLAPIAALLNAVAALAPAEASTDDKGKKKPKPTKKKKADEATKPASKIAPVIAMLHARGIYPFFDIMSEQDFKDATKMIAQIDQNGLGLPDRDNYLKADDKSKELRAAYLAHIEHMLALSGYDSGKAKSAAAAVMALETEIAKISKTRVERRDPDGLYNKIDRSGLDKRSGAFGWGDYLKARNLGTVTDINVTSIPFVEGLGKLIASTDGHALTHYLRWQVLHASAPMLSKAFVDEDFKLTHAITGQPAMRPRWKRCISATDQGMGELLAQPFVQKRFTSESKQAVESMVSEISKAFAREVQGLSWMDGATKSRAMAKLLKMAYLIGYPNKWKSYPFAVDLNAYATNVFAAASHELARKLGQIGKPVDREEWFMTPPTVNAYYNPQMNQMVFPAGILQPPFFNADANIAVNLGGMGMVVGHELTHGFDDSGSKFDADGNLRSWWEPSVRGKFDERTACVDKQYAAYEVLPGVKLNGKLTLGENIADIGGVKLAFRAYRAMRSGAQVVSLADGFNEDQQFFLSIGQIWCSKYRESFARMRAQTDTHSQPNWRVNGSLRNIPEFGEAFECAEGTQMRPANACDVW